MSQAKNCDFFKQYVTEDFNTYLTRKRSDHCHGNHIEMQALCELYNRPIEVYQLSIGMIYLRLRTVDNHGNTETMIFIKCSECRDFAKMPCFCCVFAKMP